MEKATQKIEKESDDISYVVEHYDESKKYAEKKKNKQQFETEKEEQEEFARYTFAGWN